MALLTAIAERIRPITIGGWTLHHFIEEPDDRQARSFHTAKHANGAEVDIDWTGSEVMEHADFQRWLDLGQPRRERYGLTGPLTADLIQAAHIEAQRAGRRVAA